MLRDFVGLNFVAVQILPVAPCFYGAPNFYVFEQIHSLYLDSALHYYSYGRRGLDFVSPRCVGQKPEIANVGLLLAYDIL